MPDFSHEQQYQDWLRSQELKGRKPRLEGELIPQEKRTMSMTFDLTGASPEIIDRLVGRDKTESQNADE